MTDQDAPLQDLLAATTAERHDLGPTSWVRLAPAALGAREAAVGAQLRLETPWEQREIVLFGRPVLQPRLMAWYGGLPYRYSGRTLPPRPAPRLVAALMDAVARFAGVPFNHVLLNLYRDGADSMGAHSDDEPELGPSPVVASLSLGVRRRFFIEPRKKGTGPRHTFELGGGDLLIMEGACQHTHRHGAPKQRRTAGERLNLTFRRVLRPPAVGRSRGP